MFQKLLDALSHLLNKWEGNEVDKTPSWMHRKKPSWMWLSGAMIGLDTLGKQTAPRMLISFKLI